MDNEIKEIGQQTEEGRLKIREIKKLENSKIINTIIKVLGAIICGSISLGSMFLGIQAQLGKLGENSKAIFFTCVLIFLVSGGTYGILYMDRDNSNKYCNDKIAKLEEEIKKL